MLLHGFVPVSRANGPGRRAVVWFQVARWPVRVAGTRRPTDMKVSSRMEARSSSEFSPYAAAGHRRRNVFGWEPMQQAFSLLDLIKRLREGDPEHLSFGMFTGTRLRNSMQAASIHSRTARTNWNVATDSHSSRFRGDGTVQPADAEWAATSLQPKPAIASIDSSYLQSDFEAQIVEVTVDPDGAATLTGFPVLGSRRSGGAIEQKKASKFEIHFN